MTNKRDSTDQDVLNSIEAMGTGLKRGMRTMEGRRQPLLISSIYKPPSLTRN